MQKNSGIGGQAVIDGIMMRNGDTYSIACRRPDGGIEKMVSPYKSIIPGKAVHKIPLLRGAVAFIDSLVVGISSIMWATDVASQEEEGSPDEREADTAGKAGRAETNAAGKAGRAETNAAGKAGRAETNAAGKAEPAGKGARDAGCGTENAYAGTEDKTDGDSEKEAGSRLWDLAMAGTVVVSIGFSVVLFILLPYWIAGIIGRAGASRVAVNLAEALLRIAIFIGYMLAISRMKDIQTTYAYHGAEHKCINCIESGLPLTVENVLKSSRQHRRCGTSFLLIVICISVVSFLILGCFDIRSRLMRFLWRIILIPFIAGISYEILRYAGSHDGPVINVLVKPGLALQKLVTREPNAAQAEVAITAVEAVFDWKAWQEENDVHAA